MELLHQLIGIVIHIDVHLSAIIQSFGAWTYLILFLIVFCETGLVITPMLPGDSLLFAVGAFSALGAIHPLGIAVVLTIAAIAGDTANYWIGYAVGPGIFHKKSGRLLNKKHLARASAFYEKHGGKTIVLARFAPIIRTFAPFVAGIGKMNYLRFIFYNIFGGCLWVMTFVGGGYYFGNIKFVKERFAIIIGGIIVVSLLPMIWEVLRFRFSRQDCRSSK